MKVEMEGESGLVEVQADTKHPLAVKVKDDRTNHIN